MLTANLCGVARLGIEAALAVTTTALVAVASGTAAVLNWIIEYRERDD